MNRAERLGALATEPATPNQVGAIRGQFRRLGLDRDADRPARLAASAAIAGLDELRSTKNLTEGEAGRLLRTLYGLHDRAGLDATVAAISAERQAPRRAGPDYRTLISLLADFFRAWERLQKPGR